MQLPPYATGSSLSVWSTSSMGTPAGALTCVHLSSDGAGNLCESSCQHANPLCKLAARTALGQRVCGKGCGLVDPDVQESHVCPFGMEMRKCAIEAGVGQSAWLGRRFTQAETMHRMFEMLIAQGIAEREILTSLPSNPVCPAEQLSRAVEAQGGERAQAHQEERPAEPLREQQEPVAKKTALRFPARHASDETTGDAEEWVRPMSLKNLPDQGEAHMTPEPRPIQTPGTKSKVDAPASTNETSHESAWNIFEFLEQLHALMSSAKTPAAACSRFLHAVAGVMPHREMAVYLVDAEGGDPVLEALVDSHGKESPKLKPHACRLAPHELGHQAVMRQEILVANEAGETDVYSGRWEKFSRLALPFPQSGDGSHGVWVIEGIGAMPEQMGPDPVRVMRLEADMLSARLDQLRHRESTEASQRALRISAKAEYVKFLEDLEVETVRADRLKTALTVCCLKLDRHSRHEGTLPALEITKSLQNMLRPYDRLQVAQQMDYGWYLVLPSAEAFDLKELTDRFSGVVEDTVDRFGGFEELGCELGIGVSILGKDAKSGLEMIEHAQLASQYSIFPERKHAWMLYDAEHMDERKAISATNMV